MTLFQVYIIRDTETSIGLATINIYILASDTAVDDSFDLSSNIISHFILGTMTYNSEIMSSAAQYYKENLYIILATKYMKYIPAKAYKICFV